MHANDGLGRRRRPIRRVAVATTLALASCNLFSPASAKLTVDMGGTSVTRSTPESLTTVLYHIANSGSSTAYVAACDQRPAPGSDQLIGTRWQVYWSGGVCTADINDGPLVLAAGGFVDAQSSWDIPGTYRLRVHYGEDPNQPPHKECGRTRVHRQVTRCRLTGA
jgi:hypothetical protein